METIQQKCRPKHQVLVLKCYPRTAKGAVDVKPNSSELSYLLFYAFSRRSKIQKIGSFLEKKTASDVYRLRIGKVQVTLQILTALMEKSAKDIALIAPSVLKILDEVLRSGDLTMVESSIAMFQAFCLHLDALSLLADQTNLRQYELVVRGYASLASIRGPPTIKGHLTEPVAMRWRVLGLQAIHCIASSEALYPASARQIDVIVPMVLENLWSETEDTFDMLVQRAQMEEKAEVGKTALRRRTSIVTARTIETSGDTNPLALSGTAHDVDKLAAEDIAKLAMQCLKQIFAVSSRSQLSAATIALLGFISDRVGIVTARSNSTDVSDQYTGWAVSIFIAVASWAPVQDRYVILVTAVDNLTKTQATSSPGFTSILLTTMISSLLRSNINLIGLSVIDVLLGLVQQMKRSVQLTTPSVTTGVASAMDVEQAAADRETLRTSQSAVLRGVQACIGGLATHVYYADQISDMISALLVKLRRSRMSSSTPSPRAEKTESIAQPRSQAADPESLPSPGAYLDAYFTQSLGKVAVLEAIKSILLVANPRSKMSGNPDLSRNRVSIRVWEGTDYLLRDSDGAVRQAYADALVTWLDRETTDRDCDAREDFFHRRASVENVAGLRELSSLQSASRRTTSGASNRERSVANDTWSNFLVRLHIAVYDNAHQYSHFESDYVLLHVLLAKMVERLGVNAARYGLPMIFRLQEDIQDAETPIHKVRIGSLCHGYFWFLTNKFNCENSAVGRAVLNEVVRRRSKNFWVEGVTLPLQSLDAAAGAVGTKARPQLRLPLREIESEALLPFDDRIGLVECVATGYAESKVSPPASPAASPGRGLSLPYFGSTISGLGALSPFGTDRTNRSLPSQFREQMLAEWARDKVLLALNDESKSGSLHGSRSGTAGTHNHKMRVVSLGGGGVGGGNAANGLPQPLSSPHGSQVNLRAPAAKMRKSSVLSGLSAHQSEASRGAVATVEELEMVLSGMTTLLPHAGKPTAAHPVAAPGSSGQADAALAADDSGSDSMISYDAAPSEFSNAVSRPLTGPLVTPPLPMMRDRIVAGPLTSNPAYESMPVITIHPSAHPNTALADHQVTSDTPPVPQWPEKMIKLGKVPGKSGNLAVKVKAHHRNHDIRPEGSGSRRHHGFSVRGGELVGSSRTPSAAGVLGLSDLLLGINAHSGEDSLAEFTQPPY